MSGLIITVTAAGRAALVNAEHDGTNAVRVASVGVTATVFTPTDALTALPGEIKRLTTISGGSTAADTMHVTIRDATADTYSVFGIGLYLDDDTLLATYGQPALILQKSAQAGMVLACDVQFADINAAMLTFGDTNFQLNQATTETLGILRLATDTQAIAGADTQTAVVPHALKAALDARLGVGAPSTFVKTLLTAVTALAFRALLGIKNAASFDIGPGNGLDADTLDGQHGAYYSPVVHSHAIADVTGLQVALDARPLQTSVTAQIASAVSALVNGSPGALDTLKELADAMGDDPNFAATVVSTLATKLNADKMVTGGFGNANQYTGIKGNAATDENYSFLITNSGSQAILNATNFVRFAIGGVPIVDITAAGVAVTGAITGGDITSTTGRVVANVLQSVVGTNLYLQPNGSSSLNRAILNGDGKLSLNAVSASGVIMAAGGFQVG